MKKAYSVRQVLDKRYKTYPFTGDWEAAFGHPETSGIWLIWGQSGNGKSSFVMQLCRELVKYDNVLYDSLEEGTGLTMAQSLSRHGMADAGSRLNLVCETLEDLKTRLRQRKSARVVVIDSIQYFGARFEEVHALKRLFPGKLFIFVSQAKGGVPAGSVAMRTTYEAGLKIMVEGFVAYSKGRYFGERGHYTVWEKGAADYLRTKNGTAADIGPAEENENINQIHEPTNNEAYEENSKEEQTEEEPVEA